MNHLSTRSELFVLCLYICQQLCGGVIFLCILLRVSCDFLKIVGPMFADVVWWASTEELSLYSEFKPLPRGWFSLMRILVVSISTLIEMFYMNRETEEKKYLERI